MQIGYHECDSAVQFNLKGCVRLQVLTLDSRDKDLQTKCLVQRALLTLCKGTLSNTAVTPTEQVMPAN